MQKQVEVLEPLQDNKYLVGVYGSLRPPEYNFNYFNSRFNLKVVKDNIAIPGWKLYSFGSYPGAYKSNNPEDIMYLTILETDKICKECLDDMELGANYRIVKEEVDIDGESIEVEIYEYNFEGNPDKYYQRVEHGDWVKFRNNGI
jgi:gamma-glutamylcyclotransferase (GGCT)/AIG2-like uncharacterized protein YtfP